MRSLCATAQATLPLPQLPSQTRESVSMTLTSGVMLRFSALRKMTPQASSPAIPEKIDSAARKNPSLGSTPSTTKWAMPVKSTSVPS